MVGADRLSELWFVEAKDQTLRSAAGANALMVQRLGLLDDGREVLLALPTSDAIESEVRVFVGTPPELIERQVKSPGTSDLSIQVIFDLDGQVATVAFPSPTLASFQPYIVIGNSSFLITELAADQLAPSTDFFCIY